MTQPTDQAADQAADLPDLDDTLLAALFAGEDTALAAAVRRIVAEVRRPSQAISGWSSYIDPAGRATP